MRQTVCFIFSVFPPIEIGGVQRYLLNLSRELVKHDYESKILTMYYPTLPKVEVRPYCEVHRIGLNPFPYSGRRINLCSAVLGNLFTYSILGLLEAVKIARNCSIVHSQTGFTRDIVLGSRLAKLAGKKHVVTVHQQFGRGVEDMLLTTQILHRLHEADHVIVNRTSSYDILKRNGLHRVSLLCNPIPVQEYRQPQSTLVVRQKRRRPRCLFVGRLVKRRGPDLALRGFLDAIRRGVEAELWVVGSGELEKSMQSEVDTHEASDRVRFFGSQTDVKRFLWASDIFLATSPIANSPSLALREALASGLAVVATDVEETSRVITNEKNGILVPAKAQSIGQAIEKLVQDPEKRMSLGAAACKLAEANFDISVYVKDLVRIYEAVRQQE